MDNMDNLDALEKRLERCHKLLKTRAMVMLLRNEKMDQSVFDTVRVTADVIKMYRKFNGAVVDMDPTMADEAEELPPEFQYVRDRISEMAESGGVKILETIESLEKKTNLYYAEKSGMLDVLTELSDATKEFKKLMRRKAFKTDNADEDEGATGGTSVD